MFSLCSSAERYNIELTKRVFLFLDINTLCQCQRVSTVWRQFISSYLTQVLRSLPAHREGITKNRLITHAPELLCIYKGKKGQELQFIPVAEKQGGTSLGTIYQKAFGSRWIGKVGYPNGVFRNDPNTIRTRTTKEMNSDAIREKIASDLFKELGKGVFTVPKTSLSRQKIVDPFTDDNDLAQHWETLGISECLRIMSRFVKGYHDFEKAVTSDSGQTISFMAYILKYQRPPETLLNPGGASVPLRGIMSLLAVGRLLADVDLLGGSGGNAGFYWIEEKGVIVAAQTVKIDPGFAFCCSDLNQKSLSPNLVINTHFKKGPGQYYLEDIRDLQTSTNNRDTIVYWNALSVCQKEEFLAAFLNGMRYFNSDEALLFLLHRDNLFSRSEKEQFPEEVAREMHQEIKEWATLQQEFYAEDLKNYTQQNNESLIRDETLLEIPNRSGMRLSFTLGFNKLEQTLLAITDASPKGGKIVAITTANSAIPRYLKTALIDRLLEGTDIRDVYKGSAHKVCRLEYESYDLHFKQKPSHPLMEYAIHNLIARIAGELTPPALLVRFDVDGKSYPVLISQTIQGENLKSAWPKVQANANYTWTLLCALLTRPGDGRLSNYILDPQNKLYCVDNDISFVEPVVKEVFSRTVNFCSAPFAILPLNTPLDSEVLQEFCALDSYAILGGWIEDVIQKEKEYTSLFTEQEQKRFYEEDPENSFTPTILFREGTLATLHLQFWQLQNSIALSLTQNKIPTAGDLLQMLISLHQEKIGPYIHKSYANNQPTPETKLQKATSRNQQQSMTSVQYHQACLGKIPKIEEINKRLYSPENARKEFLFTVLEKNSQYAAFISTAEGTSIQANFQDLQDDPSRQLLVLKVLIEQAKIQRPHSITIHHSNVLKASHLESLIHPSLTSLDLRYCTGIDDAAIPAIAASSELKELLLSGTNIATFQGSLLKRVLDFPKLTTLRLDHCPNLHTIQLRALKLVSFTAKHNPKLEVVRLKRSPLFQVDCTGSPQVEVTHLQLECIRTLKGHTDSVFALVPLADGTLASGSGDGTIKLWDPETGVCKQTLHRSLGWIFALVQLSDGTLASGSGDKTITLWDLKTRAYKQILQGHTDGVRALIQLSDGRLASGSSDRSIKLWDLETGDCTQTFGGYSFTMNAFLELSDGTLATESNQNSIVLINPTTGAWEQLLQGHTNDVQALVELSDGTLASGSWDGTIKLWDPKTGTCKQTLHGNTGFPIALVELPDGTLASGYRDGTIRLWDPETGTCKQTLQGHSKGVKVLEVLADGTLVSGSYDKTIKLWR